VFRAGIGAATHQRLSKDLRYAVPLDSINDQVGGERKKNVCKLPFDPSDCDGDWLIHSPVTELG
jgi:hypothetical protein